MTKIINVREDYKGYCADPHIHTKYSVFPDIGPMRLLPSDITRLAYVRESYASLRQIRKLQLKRGMDAVCISDHSTMKGVMAYQKKYPQDEFLPNCEYEVKISKQGQRIDILAINVLENHNKLLDLSQQGIDPFLDYCKNKGIPHVWAHPAWFLKNQPKITPEQFEELLDKFKILELNGDLQTENIFMAKIAEQYGKAVSGGSDDHMALFSGQTFTHAPNASNLEQFIEAFREGEIEPAGKLFRGVREMKDEIYAGCSHWWWKESNWRALIAKGLLIGCLVPCAIPSLYPYGAIPSLVPLLAGIAALGIPHRMARTEKEVRHRDTMKFSDSFWEYKTQQQTQPLNIEIIEHQAAIMTLEQQIEQIRNGNTQISEEIKKQAKISDPTLWEKVWEKILGKHCIVDN